MKRKLTVNDLFKFDLAANPILSPDGAWVIYEQQRVDEKEDGYNTQLRLVPRQGGQIRVLTSTGCSNRSAAWSPNGASILFLSNRAYGRQVWLLDMAGGEARQLTRFRYGIASPKWSADGKTVFGLVAVEENQGLKLFASSLSSNEAKEQVEKEDKAWNEGPKRVTQLRYKMDEAGLGRNRYEQLVAIDVETGVVQQLTFGSYDVDGFAVSPDGKQLAFVSNRKDPDLGWWISDVYRMSVSGGEPVCVAEGLSASRVSFSPDGSRIAILGEGAAWPTYRSAAHTSLVVVPTTGGDVLHVTENFPDTVAHTNLTDLAASLSSVPPTWSRDGRFIYALSTREGRSEIVRFSVPAPGVTVPPEGDAHLVVAGGDRDIFGFAFDGESSFVISYGTSTNPSIIASISIAGVEGKVRLPRQVTENMTEQAVPFFPAAEQRLDDTNIQLLSEVDVVAPESFYYTSQDGWRMQGWVIRPAGFEADRQYPVILEIHGGPQLNYGNMIFHEMQWLAAQGYAVVYTNPRGGMSYGQEFANGVRNHYGDGDAADVLNGLAAAVERFPFLDGDRVAVTGGSYGGFMTNWLVGHTNQFFAAVSQRSISNWISFFGVSDIGPLFCEEQHSISRIDDLDALWRISPLAYVQNVKTPLLLIHSENDLRCPIEQAEQFYTGIKRQGGDVELLRIPNASHGLSRNGKPSLRIARLQAIFEFINDRLPTA